jgi:hypothetical protein
MEKIESSPDPHGKDLQRPHPPSHTPPRLIKMPGGGIAEFCLRHRLRLDCEFATHRCESSARKTQVNGNDDQITGGFAIFPGGFGRFQALRGALLAQKFSANT